MNIRTSLTALAATTVLALAPTATATAAENPLGVPEPNGPGEIPPTYMERVSIWWETSDYWKPNCERHVTYWDSMLWYLDPENLTYDYSAQPSIQVINHYPGKTSQQCDSENGRPGSSVPGSGSGILGSV